VTDVWIIGLHLNNAALYPRLALGVEDVTRLGIVHLSKTLDRALDELVADDVLRAALESARRGFIDYSVDVTHAEFDGYHATVSGSEIETDRYLTLT
jgi:glutamine synthetase